MKEDQIRSFRWNAPIVAIPEENAAFALAKMGLSLIHICPAYDTEAGRDAQQRACSELLSEENVNTALEIMRG